MILPKDYYPTPPWLIKALIDPYLRTLQSQSPLVLDTCGGDGRLLLYCHEGEDDWRRTKRLPKKNLHFMELDPNLQAIALSKGLVMVGGDMFESHVDIPYDFIFLNVPFSIQERAILKSWEFLKPGGTMAFIASTKLLRGDTTARKHILQLHETYKQKETKVEIFEGAFEDSERQTKVEVGIWRMVKPQIGSFGVFDDLDKEQKIDLEAPDERELMSSDYIKSLLEGYEAVKIRFKEVVKANHKLKSTAGSLIHQTDISKALSWGTPDEQYSNLLQVVQKASWERLFKRLNAEKLMTSSLKNEFNELIRSTEGIPFTHNNILRIFSSLLDNSQAILQENIVRVFDDLRAFHKDNTCHWEGWKTNDAWKVQKKVIIPYGLYYSNDYGGSWGRNGSTMSKLTDLDICLTQLSGIKSNLVETLDELYTQLRQGKVEYSGIKSSEHLDFRVYKKGTLHLFFRDKFLLDQFNLTAAKGKNWLPG